MKPNCTLTSLQTVDDVTCIYIFGVTSIFSFRANRISVVKCEGRNEMHGGNLGVNPVKRDTPGGVVVVGQRGPPRDDKKWSCCFILPPKVILRQFDFFYQ